MISVPMEVPFPPGFSSLELDSDPDSSRLKSLIQWQQHQESEALAAYK